MAMAAEPAAAGGAGKERVSQGFNWSGFFRNPYIILQIILLFFLLFAVVAGNDEIGPMLMWLFFILPPWLVCVYGGHLLREWKAKLEKQGRPLKEEHEK